MILNSNKVYDGSDIHSRFAYKFLRDAVNPLGDIIIFRGPMNVTANLIDQEDLLNNDYIYSDDAINIIWEIPNLCPLGAVAFQRLFNTHIGQVLSVNYLKKPIEIDGDDLLIVDKFVGSDGKEHEKGKCSVSITISKDNIALGHTGININAGRNAPGFAYSTNLNDDQIKLFCEEIQSMFYGMLQDFFIATTKVIS